MPRFCLQAVMPALTLAVAVSWACPASAFPAVVPLAQLGCGGGSRADGAVGTDTAQAGDKLGSSAVAVGDFDGDGLADVAWGAPADMSGRPGAVYLVFGRRGGLPCPLTLNAAGVLRIDGVQADSQFGWALAAGDTNGDGVADLLIGAPGENASYLLRGQRGSWPAVVSATQASRLQGPALSGSGQSVALTDWDGDGLADLVIGVGHTQAGVAAHLVYGQAAGLPAELDLSGLDGANGLAIEGASGTQIAVAAAEDVNGDGWGDVLIGAPDAARAWLLLGQAGRGAARVSLTDPLHSRSFVGKTGSGLGFAVAGVGDMNGDGRADLALGAPLESPSPAINQAGRSYVVFGSAQLPATLDVSSLNGTNGFWASGGGSGEKSGFALAGGSDINGDGLADLVIGAPYNNYTSRAAGAAFVVYGHTGSFTHLNLAGGLTGSNGFQLSGAASGDLTGFAVSAAGDVNGDGAADLLLGARNALLSRGSAWVVYGEGQDHTAPTIVGSRSPAANVNGWNNTPVTVAFACHDSQSGVRFCTPAQTFKINSRPHSVTGLAVDVAGNRASTRVTGVALDFVAPWQRVTGVVADTVYARTPTPGCAAGDSLSGLAEAPHLVVVAGPPSPTRRPYSATCSGARDKAGNLAKPVSVGYWVLE